jgi:hypothetical protein
MLFSNKWFCGQDCLEWRADDVPNELLFCCEEHSSYICEKCHNPFLDEFDPRSYYNRDKHIALCEACYKIHNL